MRKTDKGNKMHEQDYLISLVDQIKHADVFWDSILIAGSEVFPAAQRYHVWEAMTNVVKQACALEEYMKCYDKSSLQNVKSQISCDLFGLIMTIPSHDALAACWSFQNFTRELVNPPHAGLWLHLFYTTGALRVRWASWNWKEVVTVMWPFNVESEATAHLLPAVHRTSTADLCICTKVIAR